MSRSSSGFLVRPPPFVGEALSSWRQRSGWANGYKLYPTPDERTRRVDSDLGLQTGVLEWLARTHLLDTQRLQALTFKNSVGRIIDGLDSRDQPRWWLRARYGNSTKRHGPMFCPHCLTDDDEPFFRLSWRFGFVTSCIHHDCQLLDHCPKCEFPPWPSGLGVKGRLSDRFTSLAFCWQCGYDLRNCQTLQTNKGLTERLLEGVERGTLCLGNETLSSEHALSSLWAAGQFFLRKASRDWLLLRGRHWGSFVRSLSEASHQERSIEALNVADRALILEGAWEIVGGGQESFLQFCKESELKRSHFDGAAHVQPAWMTALIDEQLPSRLRSPVPVGQILAFIEESKSTRGIAPYKYELRDRYGVQYDRMTADLRKRTQSELDNDFGDFCDAIDAGIDQASRTTRTLKHYVHDIAAILVSLIDEMELSVVVSMPSEKIGIRMREALSEAPLNPRVEKVASRVVIALEELDKRKLEAVQTLVLRQVNKRKNALMRQANDELPSDHLVFASLARARRQLDL
jgi:hypothetical protein